MLPNVLCLVWFNFKAQIKTNFTRKTKETFYVQMSNVVSLSNFKSNLETPFHPANFNDFEVHFYIFRWNIARNKFIGELILYIALDRKRNDIKIL